MTRSAASPHYEITPWTDSYAETGTWDRTQLSTAYVGGFYASLGAQNDSVSYMVPCAVGTYTLVVHGIVANSYGIATVTLDGVEIDTHDWYSGATD